MKYPNAQKCLFRGSVYYRAGEQQESICEHLFFFLSSFLQRLAIQKMVKVGKLRMKTFREFAASTQISESPKSKSIFCTTKKTL